MRLRNSIAFIAAAVLTTCLSGCFETFDAAPIPAGGGPSSSMSEPVALQAALRAAGAVPGGSVARVVEEGGLGPLMGANAYVVFEPVSFNEVQARDIIAYIDPRIGRLSLVCVHQVRPDQLIAGPVLAGRGSLVSVAPDQVQKRVAATIYFLREQQVFPAPPPPGR
jgi:hypothetical protein